MGFHMPHWETVGKLCEPKNRDNSTNGAGTTGISKNEVKESSLVVPQKAKY